MIRSPYDLISKLSNHFWKDLSRGFLSKGLDLKIDSFLQHQSSENCSKAPSWGSKFRKKMDFFKNPINHFRVLLMTSDRFPDVFRVSGSPPDPTDALFRHLKKILNIHFWSSKMDFSPTALMWYAKKRVSGPQRIQFSEINTYPQGTCLRF